jgi:hypothetical protein
MTSRVVLAFMLTFPVLAPGCGGSSGPPPHSEPAATITAFIPAAGVRFAGDSATSFVRVRNDATALRTYWIGYSVQDARDRWFDVPAGAVSLAAGQESAPIARTWRIPDSLATGDHRVVMAVWSGVPGSTDALRLGSVEQASAFVAYARQDDFTLLDAARWARGDHALGRGRVVPSNVAVIDGRVRLSLPGRDCNGSEVRTTGRHRFGSFAARLRAARTGGSVTAFFLYEDEPTGNDEIDIEIVDADNARVILAVWVAGQLTHEAEIRLPFDPREDFHEYRIDFQPGVLTFRVDGMELQRWTTGLPVSPMRLYANAWRPIWLPCAGNGPDAFAEVDWIRY